MVCNFLRGFNFADKQCNIQELNSTKEQLITTEKELKIKSENILNLIEEKNALQLEKLETEKKLKELEDSLNPDPDQVYYDNKYPLKIILYNGRTFGPTKEMIPCDVRTMLTPNDYFVTNLVNKKNLKIQEPELDVPRIYKQTKEYYKYRHDIDVYGLPEYWEMFYEMWSRVSKGTAEFDCDSWAIYQANLYLAAGLPSWKLSVTAGLTPGGEGHLTNYVFSDVTRKFHHLNSTFGSYLPMKLSEYPTTDDAYSGKDKMGIKDVWFSFNNQISRQKFYDTTMEAKFKEQRIKGTRRRMFIVKDLK